MLLSSWITAEKKHTHEETGRILQYHLSICVLLTPPFVLSKHGLLPQSVNSSIRSINERVSPFFRQPPGIPQCNHTFSIPLERGG
jgi:hypothetical protein